MEAMHAVTTPVPYYDAHLPEAQALALVRARGGRLAIRRPDADIYDLRGGQRARVRRSQMAGVLRVELFVTRCNC